MLEDIAITGAATNRATGSLSVRVISEKNGKLSASREKERPLNMTIVLGAS